MRKLFFIIAATVSISWGSAQTAIPENTFWPGGNKKDEYIVPGNDKLLIKSYDSTGHLMIEARYYKSRPHGIWKTYFPDGRLKMVARYAHGKEQGKMVEYYSNGNIRLSGHYAKGFQRGAEKEYYETGQLKRKCRYRKNLFLENIFISAKPDQFQLPPAPAKFSTKAGREILYTESGKPKEIRFYDYYYVISYDFFQVAEEEYEYRATYEPCKTGKWIFFNDEGKIVRFEMYEKNKLIDILEF